LTELTVGEKALLWKAIQPKKFNQIAADLSASVLGGSWILKKFQGAFSDLLHLLENTFDRKRISANPNPISNLYAKAQ